jgi:hypothetical protein
MASQIVANVVIKSIESARNLKGGFSIMPNATSKEAKRFVKYLSKMDFIEFIGFARILCVPFTIDNNYDNPREFEEVFSEMYDKFI